jgi:hypothetical protein
MSMSAIHTATPGFRSPSALDREATDFLQRFET